MKRLAAILLMGIFFFNWFGYRLLTSYLETRANTQLEARLDDNDYDESQLFSIKVPAKNLSYYNPSITFERADGQIEIGGVQYKYVKRRLFNDSLEMLCIPNHTAMSLRTTKNAFFQWGNDLQPNGQDKKTDQHPNTSKTPVSPEYFADHATPTTGILYAINLPTAPQYAEHLSSIASHTAEQPPDQLSLSA